jgi:hypothetical protein
MLRTLVGMSANYLGCVKTPERFSEILMPTEPVARSESFTAFIPELERLIADVMNALSRTL